MTARLSTRTIICQVSERKELKRKGGPEEVRVGSKRRQGRRPALEPKGCLPRRGIPNTGHRGLRRREDDTAKVTVGCCREKCRHHQGWRQSGWSEGKHVSPHLALTRAGLWPVRDQATQQESSR